MYPQEALVKPDLSFVCPLTRDDFTGTGSLRHCPQCDLDIPDMSALTAAEARRVLDALACGLERSEDLHFCASYKVDGGGHAAFFDPPTRAAGHLDLSSLVDTTPKLLLAIAAIGTLGLSAQAAVFERILAPAWQGHPVFVLDEDGPRLEPERVDAFIGAVDASEDAWLTLNLAAWRRDLVDALSPRPEPAPEHHELAGW
jgi:hypothetical protein